MPDVRVVPCYSVAARGRYGGEVCGDCGVLGMSGEDVIGGGLRGIPRIPERKSEVRAEGEKILYKNSFSSVSGLMTIRRVLMLKKPVLPHPFAGSEGSWSAGMVVRIEVGISASGAMLKYPRSSRREEVNSVTWRETYGILSGVWLRRPSSISMPEYWRGAARTMVSKRPWLVVASPETAFWEAVLTLYLPLCFEIELTAVFR